MMGNTESRTAVISRLVGKILDRSMSGCICVNTGSGGCNGRRVPETSTTTTTTNGKRDA